MTVTVVSDGGAPVVKSGVIWGYAPDVVSYQVGTTTDGKASGTFECTIDQVWFVTDYYVKAYATNAVGTSYGNIISFRPLSRPPHIASRWAESVNAVSVAVILDVSNDGGAPLESRGWVWGPTEGLTIESPTKIDTINDGSPGIGLRVGYITGLTPNTTYYLNAFARNAMGTTYDAFFPAIKTLEAEPVRVYIFHVITQPTEVESITLKNNSGIAQDLSGWKIGDKVAPLAYTIPQGTVLAPGETKLFSRSTLGFEINDSQEEIYLRDAEGTLIETWSNL